MHNVNLDGVNPLVAEKLRPFVDDVLNTFQERIASIYLTGSALTEDYKPRISDINTVMIFRRLSLDNLDSLAKMGRRYGRQGLSAPLVLSVEHVLSSLDVFPIEFFDLKLMHRCLYGENILAGLEIDGQNLRLQCERELKGIYVNLRQDYIRYGEMPLSLKTAMTAAFSGIMPILRALVHIGGRPVPADQYQTMIEIENLAGIKLDIMREVSQIKGRDLHMDIDHVRQVFITFHDWLGKLADLVDQMNVTVRRAGEPIEVNPLD
jgi:hypothetical protein